MQGFIDDIERITVTNTDFRRVLYTGKHCQLVVMCLTEGQNIGLEVHSNIDQFFRVEEGYACVKINDNIKIVEAGSGIVIPAGSHHDVLNIGLENLKLYTIYSPPHHKDGTIFKTKEDALASNEKFDGITTE